MVNADRDPDARGPQNVNVALKGLIRVVGLANESFAVWNLGEDRIADLIRTAFDTMGGSSK